MHIVTALIEKTDSFREDSKVLQVQLNRINSGKMLIDDETKATIKDNIAELDGLIAEYDPRLK